MIRVTDRIALGPLEIVEEFARASGPGGQNVQKVETAVRLRFDIRNSPSLADDVKARLARLSGRRLTKEGVLRSRRGAIARRSAIAPTRSNASSNSSARPPPRRPRPARKPVRRSAPS